MPDHAQGCDENRIKSLQQKYSEIIGEEQNMKQMMDEIDIDEEILKDLNLFEQDKKAYQTIMQSYMSVKCSLWQVLTCLAQESWLAVQTDRDPHKNK